MGLRSNSREPEQFAPFGLSGAFDKAATRPATSVMNLPAGFECLLDTRLFIWRPRGVLDEALVNNILAFVVDQEGKFGRPFNRFTDMSALDAVDLTFKYVFHFALHRRLSRVGRETVKSAFLVTAPEIARYIKLHALMTDHSPLQVSIFTEPEAAAKWLGVPAELLAPRK
jgi:hypothetical protein